MYERINEILSKVIAVGRVIVLRGTEFEPHEFLVLKTLMEDYGGHYCEGRLYKCFVFEHHDPASDQTVNLIMKMQNNLHLNKKTK